MYLDRTLIQSLTISFELGVDQDVICALEMISKESEKLDQ